MIYPDQGFYSIVGIYAMLGILDLDVHEPRASMLLAAASAEVITWVWEPRLGLTTRIVGFYSFGCQCLEGVSYWRGLSLSCISGRQFLVLLTCCCCLFSGKSYAWLGVPWLPWAFLGSLFRRLQTLVSDYGISGEQ